ncbi:MAG: hypothetical protein HN995_07035 [Candidatus Marinimicrobia bacterium]|nr:hypothetical protein [Candidatus Neomarinimicrobiota bacterium]MBT3680980.1 hypothetical protein [Candidatus Neomarinimicrobiota bacterium]MBT3952113.1 hypothetical protein [Candidatus Neomarinimicrobiota bacterium]MBT4254311.1 hypothetical protein [Candidatus Neomarinimicrobiota bacterium]MBT4479492.1 hypothetical protein [Candidatus Neomarinimicrobiota bacterium]
MIRKVVCVVVWAVIAFGQFEVISISEGLSEQAIERLWPVHKGGAIVVNDKEVFIPDGSSLFLQRRSAPFDYTRIDLKRHKRDAIKIYEVTVNNEFYAYSVLGADNFVYLFKRDRRSREFQGPVLRHGKGADRIFLLSNNNLVATGSYRPALINYLARYMKGSLEEQRLNKKEKYDPLYKNHKAYTISVYNNDLTETDSSNVIDRTGDNARAYEGLYLTLAVDMTADENLFLIDNDQGYVVEKYSNVTNPDTSFEIKNSNFKKIPDVMTLKHMHELRDKDKAYSVPYALYEKDGYLITCFFQAPVYRKPVKPPYYFDVSTIKGEVLHSGDFEYPFLCEDDGEKVFLYVKRTGGWFEDDTHFLVGVTVEDLLSNQVTMTSIDASVEQQIKD